MSKTMQQHNNITIMHNNMNHRNCNTEVQ